MPLNLSSWSWFSTVSTNPLGEWVTCITNIPNSHVYPTMYLARVESQRMQIHSSEWLQRLRFSFSTSPPFPPSMRIPIHLRVRWPLFIANLTMLSSLNHMCVLQRETSTENREVLMKCMCPGVKYIIETEKLMWFSCCRCFDRKLYLFG